MPIPRLTKDELLGAGAGEASARVRSRVAEARERQRRRYADLDVVCNAHLPGPVARRICRLSRDGRRTLSHAVDHMALTGRGFDRVVKVARTIADLQGSLDIGEGHVAEALSYRAAFDDEEELTRAG